MALISEKDRLPPDESVELWVGKVDQPTQFTKLKKWNSYNISQDIMEPAHTFDVDFAGDREQREQVAKHGGQRCVVLSHGALQLTGIVDERSDATNKQGTDNKITGRSTAGLPQDSVIPNSDRSIAGLTLRRLAEKWLGPWMPSDIPKIITNAAASRYIAAGGYIWVAAKDPFGSTIGGRLVSAINDNVFIVPRHRRKRYGKFGKNSPYFAGTASEQIRTSMIERGTKAFDAIHMIAAQIGAHVWQSVDGSIIISRPSYDFDASAYGQSLELHWDKNLDKATGGNIESVELNTSIAERHSEYKIVSTVKSDKAKKASDLFHVKSIKDPGPAFWDDSLSTERLHRPGEIRASKISSPDLVSRIARREMCSKAIGGFDYTIMVAGHHSRGGALWTIDSTVNVDDERNGIKGPMYIKRVERRFDKQSGRTTVLSLIPPDIWLGQFDSDSVPTDTFNQAMRQRIFW